jgi:hypothetical protein
MGQCVIDVGEHGADSLAGSTWELLYRLKNGPGWRIHGDAFNEGRGGKFLSKYVVSATICVVNTKSNGACFVWIWAVFDLMARNFKGWDGNGEGRQGA